MENKLRLNKIIYPKRRPYRKDEFMEIIKLEIDHHIINNPGLRFVKMGKSFNGEFGTVVYPLIFTDQPKIDANIS